MQEAIYLKSQHKSSGRELLHKNRRCGCKGETWRSVLSSDSSSRHACGRIKYQIGFTPTLTVYICRLVWTFYNHECFYKTNDASIIYEHADCLRLVSFGRKRINRYYFFNSMICFCTCNPRQIQVGNI